MSHVTAAADVGRFNQFKDCLFVNEDPATVQATVFGIGGGTLTRPTASSCVTCWQYGVAKWDRPTGR